MSNKDQLAYRWEDFVLSCVLSLHIKTSYTGHNGSAYQQTLLVFQEIMLKFPALRTKGLELLGETYSF